MFENVNGVWLDGAFFNVLRYVDGMHIFFMEQARYVAMICFVLSLGISCVKMVMGAMELNKILTQAFISVATYFIMIFLFPHIMISLQKIVSELSHGAVFSQGFTVSLDRKYGSANDFYKYLNEIGTDKNGVTIWAVRESSNGSPSTLDLQITHKETGIISLNRIFQMIIVTFKAFWKSLDVKNVFNFFIHFADFLMIIVIGLVYLWALSKAIVQYAMIVIQYAFLYGMGVLFIPMMLWEGSKHAFEKLCGSIFNIGVRLLVIQTTLYLAVMANMDILKNMFVLTNGNAGFLQGIEFYLSIAFLVIFVKLFVDQAPAIAEFLCGGQPSIGFGAFAAAAASAAAAGTMAAGAGKSMIKGGATAGAAAVGAIGAAGGAAHDAASNAKAQGGGAGDMFKAGISSFGKSLGQSAVQGGANVLDKGIDAVTNGPKNLGKMGNMMKGGIDPSLGGGNQNSSGKGNNGGANGQDGKKLMKSKNISDRAKGIGAQYSENREKGGKFSGLGGRVKALQSSVGNFHKANKKEAPGK